MHFSAQKFEIAISYSGTNRKFVQEVDRYLLERLDRSEVFYDQRYTAHMARPDLDSELRNLYSERAQLVVIFLSERYGDSPWCHVEVNAARQAHQENPDSNHPMLFSEGKLTSTGFAMDNAVPIDGMSPSEVGALIIEKLRDRRPRLPITTFGLRRKRAAFKLSLLLMVLGFVIVANKNPEMFGKSLPEDLLGVGGLIIFVLIAMIGLYYIHQFVSLRKVPPQYVQPPSWEKDKAPALSEVGNQLPTKTSADDWEDYARKLEEYHKEELAKQSAMMRRQRESRYTLQWSICFCVVLALLHFGTELCIRNLPQSEEAKEYFLPVPSSKKVASQEILPTSGLSADALGSRDGSLSEVASQAGLGIIEVLAVHRGHLLLGGVYLLATSIGAFWIANRTQRPLRSALFLGVWPAFYVGLVYVLFGTAQNYDGFFGGSTEPGNFYVYFHILVIPAICLLGAFLAGALGLAARGKQVEA